MTSRNIISSPFSVAHTIKEPPKFIWDKDFSPVVRSSPHPGSLLQQDPEVKPLDHPPALSIAGIAPADFTEGLGQRLDPERGQRAEEVLLHAARVVQVLKQHSRERVVQGKVHQVPGVGTILVALQDVNVSRRPGAFPCPGGCGPHSDDLSGVGVPGTEKEKLRFVTLNK